MAKVIKAENSIEVMSGADFRDVDSNEATWSEERRAKYDLLTELVKARVTTMPYFKESTIPGVRYSCQYAKDKVIYCCYEPTIAYIFKGHKISLVGSEEFNYGPGTRLVVSVNIPSTYCYYNVTPQNPFVGIAVSLNRDILAELFESIGRDYFTQQINNTKDANKRYAVSVDEIDDESLDVLLRLTDLERSDDEVKRKILAKPLLTELFYHVLTSPHGTHLFTYYHQNATHKGIARSIDYLKTHFKEEFEITEVASGIAFMQPATFFKRFKESTGLSPLQFKKRLRLLEAKRLIEVEKQPVSSSAYEVGYSNLPQFSRDFKQFFNIVPSKLSGDLSALDPHHANPC